MILCCGEALIDMIPMPTTSGQDGFVPHAGGAVFNTAIALGRLERSAGLLTGLSTDSFGQLLLDRMQESGVQIGHVIRSDRPSTLAFVMLEQGQAHYNFFDENSAGRMITAQDLPQDLPAEITALFFGGISLACEPCADTYAELLERAGTGRAVMIDPNIRPGFIAQPERYRARLSQMLERCDIVKVSDEDLDWLHPGPHSIDRKIDALLGQGPSVVLVTRGAEGAVGYLPDGRSVHVPSQPVKVADTVGAGDTFNAGVLAHLSEQGALTVAALRDLDEHTLRAALSYGVKTAAVTVSRAGANPPWLREL